MVRAYLDKGDHDKAIADYTEAIRLDPKYAEAYSNRGVAYASKGDYDKAIADYTEAIRLDPKDGRRVLQPWLRPTRARATTTRRSPTTPRPSASTRNTPRRTTTVASAYGSKGDYDKAIADYTEAIRLNPDFVRRTTTVVWPTGARAKRAGRKQTSRRPSDLAFWKIRGKLTGLTPRNEKATFQATFSRRPEAMTLVGEWPAERTGSRNPSSRD